MVLEGGPMLIRSWMNQVHELRAKKIQVIWVTSGAIATARKKTGKVPNVIREKQALSAIGQPHLISHYLLSLHELGASGAQILLTAEDLRSRRRRQNLKQTLRTLLEWNYLPILNENDAVATEEIQFGDNDRLASLVAVHMKATRLVLLTDVEGLYDRDPHLAVIHPNKQIPPPTLISELVGISPRLIQNLEKTDRARANGYGRGGMLSKILAAKVASQHGVHAHLVKGDSSAILTKIAGVATNGAEDKMPGTHVRPKRKTS